MIDVTLDSGWLRTELVIDKLAKVIHTSLFRKEFKRSAMNVRRVVQKQIRSRGSGDWAKLSRWTIASRKFRGFGGTRPLINTGSLLNGVRAETNFSAIDAEMFVGYLSGDLSGNGTSLVSMASISEYGVGPFIIRVTPKSRKLIGAISTYLRGSPSSGSKVTRGKGYIITSIPARPIFSPLMEDATGIFSVVMNAMVKNILRELSELS